MNIVKFQVQSIRFLTVFLKFSGLLEIIFGLLIICIGPIMVQMDLPFLPFWHLAFGTSLASMGILLWLTGKNLDRYAIFPFISCGYRFIIAGFQLFTAFTVPELHLVMILGGLFDIFAPLFILYLLIHQKIHLKI